MKSYRDITGDGGSKIIEQVLEQKARIEKNLSSIQQIVAIGSGKGGVGKSTLTMQLAFSFKKRGLKVSVLDGDFNGPSLSRISGTENSLFIPDEKGFSIPKTKNGVGVVSFGTIFAEPESVNFKSVSKGESYIWRSTKEFATLGEILSEVNWGELDLLLIDLPPGVERTFQFAEYFDHRAKFVLVTVPSSLSCGIVARSVSALKEINTKILGYIENMKGYFCPECKETKPLFPSSNKIDLGIPCLGSVPFDPELARNCDRGIPLTDFPNLPSSKSVDEISENIFQKIR